MNALACHVASLWLCASLVADIGPKPRTHGSGLEIPAKDMKGVGVEMAAEEVTLTLGKSKKDGYADELRVHAVFQMRNDGEETSFETGFPVGPFKNMTGFAVKVNGASVESHLIDRLGKRSDSAENHDAKKPLSDYWYVWDARYAGKAATTVEVDYALAVHHFSHYRWTGYVLHTGAAWKGVIGRAVVTLKCSDGLTLDHLRSVSPLKGAEHKGDRIVWTFENLEPAKDDDINLSYNRRETWQEELAHLRVEAETAWYSRRSLAHFLREAASRKARTKLSDEEAGAYAAAMKDLLSELREEGGKFILPGSDPSRVVDGGTGKLVEEEPHGQRRSYAELAGGTKQVKLNTYESFKSLFEELLKEAAKHPGHAGMRDALGAYRDFMKHFLAGDLHVDLRSLKPGRRPRGEGTLFQVGALEKNEEEECRRLIQSAEERISGTGGGR